MMFRIIKLFLILIISGLSLFLHPQNNQSSKKNTEEKKEFDVIFVVDVSTADNEYRMLVENFINSMYDAFQGSSKENDKNNYYLITVSNRIKLVKNSKMDKDLILKEIKSQFGKQQSIYLKQGLSQVFDLMANDFFQKVGVVLFLSNGNDRKINLGSAREDVKGTIHALKNLGVNVFSIYLSAGPVRCKECMLMISEWSKNHFSEIEKKSDVKRNVEYIVKEAQALIFSSPVERKINAKIEKEKIEWKNKSNQFKYKTEELQKEIEKIRSQLENEKNRRIFSEQFNNEKTMPNNNQKYTGSGILSFMVRYNKILCMSKKKPLNE